MDNSNQTSSTQQVLGDASSIDVPDHLESGEPNIVALALALHNHQEALKKGSKRCLSEYEEEEDITNTTTTVTTTTSDVAN